MPPPFSRILTSLLQPCRILHRNRRLKNHHRGISMTAIPNRTALGRATAPLTNLYLIDCNFRGSHTKTESLSFISSHFSPAKLHSKTFIDICFVVNVALQYVDVCFFTCTESIEALSDFVSSRRDQSHFPKVLILSNAWHMTCTRILRFGT